MAYGMNSSMGTMAQQHMAQQGVSGTGHAAGVIGTGAVLGSHESEVQRELRRMSDSIQMLSETVDAVWERCGRGGLLAPPAPQKDSPAIAVESTDCQLGATIQEHTLRVQSASERLCRLMDYLRI